MNDKEFTEKFDKPENQFAILEVNVPIRNRDDLEDTKTYYVKRSIQLVIKPDGSIAGRFV